MVLPVKVSLAEAGHVLAHTVDINRAGARIGGLREQLAPGTIVHLQRGSRKGKFRVIWAQQVGPGEMQAGLEALDASDAFWGVDLRGEERAAQKETEAMLTLLGRRGGLDSGNPQ